MASSKWVDSRFGERLKAERERRRWTQPQMADLLSDRGIAPMHATTIAKIEAGSRSVRINEAVGIADLFDVSLDSLLGRKPGAQRSELTYRLRVLRDNTEKSAAQVARIEMSIREQLDELPGEFDGADKLKEMGYNTLRNYLKPASKAVVEVSFAAGTFLQREQERLEASEEALTELEVPEDEAQS